MSSARCSTRGTAWLRAAEEAELTVLSIPWEGIEATLENEPVKYFDYADYGLPNQYSVLLELQAEAGEYRDVSSRLEQLKVQMGS
mgnify:CR=1 FL=1